MAKSRQNMEAYLSKQAPSDLVRIIMEQADIDDEFYAMLRLRIATDQAKPDTSEMKGVLRQVMEIDDFIPWRDTHSYMHGVDRVLGQLRTMLTPEHAAEVIGLAEYALDLWEESIESIDDSNGCMGMIRDDIHGLHLDACKIAKPDPVVLAERLSLRAINSRWEMFCDSYQAYSNIFGREGRARYREIVEKEWNKLPRVGPGEKDPERYGRATTLEHMMLAFAEEDDDLDSAIRTLSRDLSHPYTYLQIAERCRKGRKYALAREWAERGLADFPDKPDSRLRSFLAEEYLRAKRPDDVMAMIWANFVERISLETYQDLAKHSRKLKCWNKWREKAFTHMRSEIERQKTERGRRDGGRAYRQMPGLRWASTLLDHSLLVAVLLWEKRDEDAWTEAQEGGCSEGYWLKLAKLREEKHPEDAIRIYRRQVAPLVDRTNNSSYEQAIEFLGKVQRIMKRIGKEKEFRTDLACLKDEYKRKRNFIKYIERKAWGR